MCEGKGVSERLNDAGCELGETIELLRTIAESDATLKGDAIYAFVTALQHIGEQLHGIHDDAEREEWGRKSQPQAA
jgi:hypothetical protein